MLDPALAGMYSIATAATTGTFSIFVRRGQAYGNAATGVLIGLIVVTPPLVVATWWLWRPEWWNPLAFFYLAVGGPNKTK